MLKCKHGQLKRQCPLCEKDEEIARLRKALEFYAVAEHHDYIPSLVYQDKGERAREALNK